MAKRRVAIPLWYRLPVSWTAVVFALAVCGGVGLYLKLGTRAATLPAAGYYATSGSQIIDSGGRPVVFSGINWFGFETANYAPHGLWSRSMDSMLDQIKSLGYTVIRLPYCNQMFDSGSASNGIDFGQNPDLQGLTPVQVMDKVVSKAGARGLKIILDQHRPDSGAQSELWYTSAYPESRWLSDWQMLANRYKNNPAVIGADLHNEPHGSATWGSGNAATDWRLAAEKGGNAILAANPNWLILVEGVESYNNNFYWWGGNLMGAKDFPVNLNVPGRLVYSPHDYGPGVFAQTWFSAPNFPANLPGDVWDPHWGYLAKGGAAPVLVGEFGGRSVDTLSIEGKWQNALVDYLKATNMSWTYWCLNPNSGDTGGVLMDDWVTVNQPKQDMLARAIVPLPGGSPTPSSSPTPSPTPSPSPSPTPSATPSVSPTPSPPPSPFAVPLRIDAGATTSFTDSSGNVWRADVGAGDGEIDTKTLTITGTTSPGLYLSERYGMSAYHLPIANGVYQLNLKFAETYFTTAGSRVFNVTAEGQTLLSNFDLVAKTGGIGIADNESFTVQVADGVLDIGFSASANYAQVAAIEVLAAATSIPGDIDGNGKVNIFDLSALLSKWGTSDAKADINHSGVVDVFDLSALLSHWTG